MKKPVDESVRTCSTLSIASTSNISGNPHNYWGRGTARRVVRRSAQRRALPLLVLACLLLAGIATVSAATPRPWYAASFEKLGFSVFDPPMTMKDFLVVNLNGASKTRASAKGNIVLLNFWATWCPPCKAEMPSIEALSAKMKGKKFEIIAINAGDSAAEVKDFLKENKYTFPIYLDTQNKLLPTYAGQGIPTTYVLDKQGRFIAGVVGGVDYSRPEVVNLLTKLAEE